MKYIYNHLKPFVELPLGISVNIILHFVLSSSLKCNSLMENGEYKY